MSIKTLEDLKKLIKKDVNVIYDSQFLSKILDLEKTLNQELGVEDVLPEMGLENKN